MSGKTETAGTTSYAYDGLGRLKTETQPGSVVYSYLYDDYHNRSTMTVTGGTDPGTTTYAYDKNNRLLTETKALTTGLTEVTRYQYDNNGNQIYKGKETFKNAVAGEIERFGAALAGDSENNYTKDTSFYEYDGLNRLTKANAGGHAISYKYNGYGLRMSKNVDGALTYHVWDGSNMVMEMNGSGAATAKYIRGINLISGKDAVGAVQYYLFNGHGDVSSLTDSAGNVKKNYTYDAFGNEKNPDPNDTNVFRYTGEYFDKETGTIYLRARYYDPRSGRFVTEDTVRSIAVELPNGQKIDDPLSLNLYTYCYNNPILYNDPDGHVPVETIIDVASIGWSFSDFVRNPSWGNFGFLAWDVVAAIVPYAPGSYVAKGIKAGTKILSKADEFTKTGVWAMKAFDRGWEIEKALGGWCNNFPVIDWANKTFRAGKVYLENIKSIKSIDITAKTYQKASTLKSALKRYVNDLVNFTGATYDGVSYKVVEGTSRTLEIAIPPVEMTAAQAKAFQEIVDYALEKGIEIVTRIVE